MLLRIVRRLPTRLLRAVFRGGQRSDRLRDPDAVVAALRVRPRDRVADLGPGYGHFTLRLCRAVGSDGIVYAADADADTLDDLLRAADERAIINLRPVLTSRRRLELPEPVDLLFVSATYHHLRRPVRYFAQARSLLRPTGRVAILESRLEGVAARRLNPHGSVPRRVHAQMSRAGYELIETHDVVPGHWFAVFRAHPEASSTSPAPRSAAAASAPSGADGTPCGTIRLRPRDGASIAQGLPPLWPAASGARGTCGSGPHSTCCPHGGQSPHCRIPGRP